MERAACCCESTSTRLRFPFGSKPPSAYKELHLSLWNMQYARESLQARKRHPIAHGSILVSGVCGVKCELRINHVQDFRLAFLVTQRCELQAIPGELRGMPQSVEFPHGCVRFRIEGLNIRQKLAFSQRQPALGLPAPQLGLFPAALRSAPIRYRSVLR